MSLIEIIKKAEVQDQLDFRTQETEAFINAKAATNTQQPTISRIAKPWRTTAGVPITADTSQTVSSVWACVRYLTQTISPLPWHVIKQGSVGSEIQVNHPVDYLLHHRPCSEYSSFQFRECLMRWALLWGNGYAEIEWDMNGRPFGLWPIHPERVRVCRDPNTDQLFYEIDGKYNLLPEGIFHIRGCGDGPVGLSVMHYAAETIGWAKAAQIFGAAFFGNGMTPSAILKLKELESPDAIKERRKELDAMFKGPHKSANYLLLDEGDEYTPLSIEPDKAQFILTNQHLIEEVCRWFGVPPHKIMHLLRATFSNIEHQSIEIVVDAVSPWAKRFEDEADYKLFGQNRQNLATKIYLQGLLRGDITTRTAWYKTGRELGVLSANDICRLEDMNTIGPEGDKRVMQSQFTTLEKIGQDLPKPPPTAPSPASESSGTKAAKARILRRAYSYAS